MKFHIHWFKFFITLFLTILSDVVLLVFIDVGGCLCLIYSSACRARMNYLQFIYRSPSSAYADENIDVLLICAIVRMTLLFIGSVESLDMKKCPPTLILVFVSDG